jgi:hypothetical protein
LQRDTLQDAFVGMFLDCVTLLNCMEASGREMIHVLRKNDTSDGRYTMYARPHECEHNFILIRSFRSITFGFKASPNHRGEFMHIHVWRCKVSR